MACSLMHAIVPDSRRDSQALKRSGAELILHFFHHAPYPIIDFRALWSVSLEEPAQYSFGFWWPYVEYCREVAEPSGHSTRKLDQALWQYSKENQRPV